MRKYNYAFSVCPVPGCVMPIPNYATQSEHFGRHLKWELAQGSIALFDEKGIMKAVERRKA